MVKLDDDYMMVKIADMSFDAEGRLVNDLFIYLPTLNRYIRFIPAGEALDDEKVDAIKKHTVPEFFMRKGSSLSEPPPGFEIISKEQTLIIKQLSKEFLEVRKYPADSNYGQEQYRKIITQSDAFLSVISPDLKTLRRHLMRTIKHIHLMTDAAAISTLATLFALANDFRSQKSFRELTIACLVMDAALAEFSEEELKTFYISPQSLPSETVARIHQHPTLSYEVAREKMSTVNETTLQLVLCHHELFNGKGYPRGIRYESLIPLTKVLSLAVDVSDTMKRKSFLNEEFSFEQTLNDLRDGSGEAHLRRQNRQLVENVIRFTSQENGPEVTVTEN